MGMGDGGRSKKKKSYSAISVISLVVSRHMCFSKPEENESAKWNTQLQKWQEF